MKNQIQNTSENRGDRIKIIFDCRMLGHSGIGMQVQSLLPHLFLSERLTLTLLGDPDTIYEFFPDFSGKVIPFRAPIYSLKEQILYPKIPAFTILHVPHYNAPLKCLSKSVVVVHDLIHIHSDEFRSPIKRFYARSLLGCISKKSRAISTVSETTRHDLIQFFPNAASRAHTIHNGLNHELFKPQLSAAIKKFKQKHNLPAEYLLTVGIGKKHKNVDFIIRALSPLWKKGLIPPLVIGGSGGKLPDYVKEEVERQNASSYLQIMPFLDIEELPLLYAGARCLLMPSVLEGFGFPVIEAMAVGTPVLCSRASSLPEVGGNAALYFDPYNEQDLQSILTGFLKSRKLQKELHKEGLSRANQFTWSNYSQQLIELYELLAADWQ